MKPVHALFLTILLIFPFSAKGIYNPITTRNLLISDGISHTKVNCIAQDKKGFIWASTIYGLNRYDGEQFKSWHHIPHKSNGLSSNNIKCIRYDDNANRLWIAPSFSGINILDCEKEIFYSFKHEDKDETSLSSNNVRDIHISNTGDVWIATDKGIDLYDEKTSTFTHYNNLMVKGFPEGEVCSISSGPSGAIYLGHRDKGFSEFYPESRMIVTYNHEPSNKNSLASNYVLKVYTDKDGRVWIGTGSGLVLFDSVKKSFLNFKDIPGIEPRLNTNIFGINKTIDGTIWIGTSTCLCYFNINHLHDIISGKQDVFYTFVKDEIKGIANPTVLDIFQDCFENIWIGSNGGGLSLIPHIVPPFQTWRKNGMPNVENQLNDKEILCLYADEEDRLWIGTDGGGINTKERDGNFEYLIENSKINAMSCSAILKDSKGKFWFGYPYNGIEIYSPQKNLVEKFNHTIINNCQINDIKEDDYNRIWIGTNNGLVIYNQTSHEFFSVTDPDGLINNKEIYTINHIDKNIAWIGLHNDGVAILQSDSACTSVSKLWSPFPNLSVTHIYQDSKKQLWLATDCGLALVNTQNLDSTIWFTQESHNLICNQVYAIQEDDYGRIWISTNKGISCLSNSYNWVMNFDSNDNVLPGPYLPHSVTRTSDGSLYFGSMNGICYFSPSELNKKSEIPPVTFTNIEILNNDSKNLSYNFISLTDKTICLSYLQNVFSVDFCIMDKALRHIVEYQYRMKGLGDEWVSLGNNSQVSFNKIPAGNYELQVRAKNKNANWSEEYSSLSITITPPLWMTWWAKSLYIVGLLLLLILIAISYKKQLIERNKDKINKLRITNAKKANEERIKFFTNITHEIRTPLSLILGPIEDLKRDSSLNCDVKQKIEIVERNATRLLDLSKHLLEFRKVETSSRCLRVQKDDIGLKLKEIGSKFVLQTEESSVNFYIDIPSNTSPIFYDSEVITIIVDNLLSNSFKYTESGNVILTMRQFETKNDCKYTDIMVKDTGVGIPETDRQRIFEIFNQSDTRGNKPGFGIGLALVQKLSELHEAEIFVDSIPDQQTTFTIRLKTDNTYPNAIHIENEYGSNLNDNDKITTNFKQRLILVVEDEDDLRKYIVAGIAKDYKVVTASNGTEALAIISASMPDIVISDIMMPGINGLDLCKRVKENPETEKVSVILLSAKDTLSDKVLGYEVGADSYITKPFSMQLLNSRISNLLESKKRMNDAISSNISIKQQILNDSLSETDKDFLNKLISLIEQNVQDENFDANYLAKQMGMSYSSLYRRIKQIGTYSINDLIRKIRVREAEKLLLSGKYNISEISMLVGINSLSHFRECFKQEFGVTPSEYLSSIKNK